MGGTKEEKTERDREERQGIRDRLTSLQNRHLVWNRTQRSHIISLCLRACVCVGVPAHENVHCFWTFVSGCMCVGLSERLYLFSFFYVWMSFFRSLALLFSISVLSLHSAAWGWQIGCGSLEGISPNVPTLEMSASTRSPSFFLIILFFQLPAPSLVAQSHLKERHRPYKILVGCVCVPTFPLWLRLRW